LQQEDLQGTRHYLQPFLYERTYIVWSVEIWAFSARKQQELI